MREGYKIVMEVYGKPNVIGVYNYHNLNEVFLYGKEGKPVTIIPHLVAIFKIKWKS